MPLLSDPIFSGKMGNLVSSVIGTPMHQSQLSPESNKFHVGNGSDWKHYWLTPPELYAKLDAEFGFDFDP